MSTGENIRITAAERPVLAHVEQELRRALDRKALAALRDVVGEVGMQTTVSLSHISGDEEVPGQQEVLEVSYELVVDLGGLPEDRAELWDRLTDVFYGYDADVGTILDLRLVRALCNAIELDGFHGHDFDAFRAPGFGGQSVIGQPTAWFEDEAREREQRPRPLAISECAPDFVLPPPPEGDPEDFEAVVRHLVASFVAEHGLGPVDPALVEGDDTLWALVGYDDGWTEKLGRCLLGHVGIEEPTTEHVMITVGCAVRVLGAIHEAQNSTIHDRLRAHGMFEMSAGDRLEGLGLGGVDIECLSVEPVADGQVKTFNLVFQCDDSPEIRYQLASDGTVTVSGYTDWYGHERIEDSRYFDEMFGDLSD